jgi:hypothetical protein
MGISARHVPRLVRPRRPNERSASVRAQLKHLKTLTSPTEVQDTSLKMGADDARYHPQDAIGAAITGTMITGSAGLFMSAVQNALARKNVGPWGVFTRSGGTIAVFGMCSSRQMYKTQLNEFQRRWAEHMNSQSSHLPT